MAEQKLECNNTSITLSAGILLFVRNQDLPPSQPVDFSFFFHLLPLVGRRSSFVKRSRLVQIRLTHVAYRHPSHYHSHMLNQYALAVGTSIYDIDVLTVP